MRRLTDQIGLRHTESGHACGPEGTVLFVIGDIAGCVQPLVDIHQNILRVAELLPPQKNKIIIYLGDYVDHGQQSFDVIDLLVSAPLVGFKSVYLLGDQDLNLIRFLRGGKDVLRGDQRLIQWLNEKGGLETLRSYGVQIKMAATSRNMMDMRIELLRKIPTDHISFLQNLHLSYSSGDFFFSHAGAKAGKRLDQQMPSDLLLGHTDSEIFMDLSNQDKVIVHAHVALKTKVRLQNRISLYTDPAHTGHLKALMIDQQRLCWIESSETDTNNDR